MARPDDDALAQTAAQPSGDALADTAASDPGGDPLAATTPSGDVATAPDSKPFVRVDALGGSLGRYKLERELGAGGMGVVYAAFDPDLERRVALKVLRGRDSDEARQRLLREARAMARLSHPNVAIVHEVGSAAGRDYVAMEMIEGGTLEQWLRAGGHTEREIVSAFVAAGRGLAAAHAAGLVHRDFKPHNVLRHRDGRIAVTDFGLVVGIQTSANQISLESTLAPGQAVGTTSGNTPSSLSGLTATGSVLGTPAYMAPEQWSDANVGPAADQFAFCVALWEALAGERPFGGNTIEELQKSLDRGPEHVDDSKLPRRLRPILKRGLSPEPDQRWPSMDVLLAELKGAERRPQLMFAIAGAALLVVAVVVFALTRDRSPAAAVASCDKPLLDPATIVVPASQTYAAATIASDAKAWREIRERACKDEPAVRAVRLACLDGVAARMDLVARALTAVGGTRRLDAVEFLHDPSDCAIERPPRLARSVSPAWVDAVASFLRATTAPLAPLISEADADSLVQRTTSDPCAHAQARVLARFGRTTDAKRQEDLEVASQQAARCGDDRLVADVAVQTARAMFIDDRFTADAGAKLREAEAVVELTPQSTAALELVRSLAAQFAHEDVDQAIAHTERSLQLYAERGRLTRQIVASLELVQLLELRGTPADQARIETTLRELLALARGTLAADDALVIAIENRMAWMTYLVDPVAGNRELLKTHVPERLLDVFTATGRVVDGAGKPVAGANVAASVVGMYGDSITAAVPRRDVRFAITDADGHFTIADAPRGAAVIAWRGDERSAPGDSSTEPTLVLAPTSRLEGTVALNGLPLTRVRVMVRDFAQPLSFRYFGQRAALRPDGTFTVSGVPRKSVVVQTLVSSLDGELTEGKRVDATKPTVTGIALTVNMSSRVVHLLVRSTVELPVPSAVVFALPGTVKSSNMAAMTETMESAVTQWARTIDETTPDKIRAASSPGDLYGAIKHAPIGTVSACAVGLPLNAFDPVIAEKLNKPANRKRIAVSCVTLGANDEIGVVEVPPWPRLD